MWFSCVHLMFSYFLACLTFSADNCNGRQFNSFHEKLHKCNSTSGSSSSSSNFIRNHIKKDHIHHEDYPFVNPLIPLKKPLKVEKAKLKAGRHFGQFNDSSSSHAIRHRRSVFLLKQNGNERYIIAGEERPATNKTRPYPRPRFSITTGSKKLPLDPTLYACREKFSNDCWVKARLFRNRVVNHLSKSLERTIDEPNYYNVEVEGWPGMERDTPPYCLIQQARVQVLRRKDHPFNEHFLGKYFPKQKLFKRKKNSCAIVSSSGSLIGSNLGDFIDGHDIVMRFNHAPVEGYESDVGSKTTIRVVNSQVVTKPEFNFVDSKIFQNVTIAAWDPGKYNGTLDDWLNNADFDLFTNYEKFRKKYPKAPAYLINPHSIWRLWRALQLYTMFPIRKNPPSSGFIGIALLLPYCYEINVIEYIPSTRLNGLCHYYNKEINSACTFGAWHPLAAEKLMALDMNTGYDFTVFQLGIASITKPDMRLCEMKYPFYYNNDPLV